MNLGFLAASFTFDYLRKHLGEHGHFVIPIAGARITTYRALFLVSLLLEFALLPLMFSLRKGAEATDDGLNISRKEPVSRAGETFFSSVRATIVEGATGTVRMFKGLVSQDGFYRLLGFLMLIAFLKLIFMQMYYVYPEFGIRELGEGAPIGRLWGLNSVLIILLVPVVGALTQRFQAYNMVTLGGVIVAASVFVMALPVSWFSGLANGVLGHWLGHGYLGLKGPVHPYYLMIGVGFGWRSFLFSACVRVRRGHCSQRPGSLL
jgi:hypothetical protein